MISANIQRLKYIVGDLLSANIAMVLFNITRYFTLEQWNFGYENLYLFLSSTSLVWEQIFIPPILLIVYYLSGYYNIPFQKSRLQELISTLVSTFICTLLIYFALLTNDQVKLRTTNYELVVSIYGIFFCLTYIVRLLITSHGIQQMRIRNWKFNTIIVGNSISAHRMGEKLADIRNFKGYNIIGYVDLPGESSIISSKKSFSLENIEEICREYSVSTIILSPQKHQENVTLALLYRLFPLNIPIKISPDTLSLLTSNIRLQSIYEEPLIDITTADISESTKNIKRIFDIIISALALIVLAIPMIVIAILVKRDSHGSVFYSQQRIGYKQRPFKIHKFRTMRIDAENQGPQLSSENDSRVTHIGKVLRKYRLDELPQFWNVLRGDMSIVGPRPEREFYIQKIVEKAPYYTLVHQVRPGITSWGMVKYGYAKNVDEMVRRLRYDLIYLGNMSIIVDFKIIVYTVKTVLTGRGM